MDQDHTDAKHHKHLRDMFRLFQRAKRQREKARERAEDESKESKVPAPIAPVHSQHSRRIPSLSDKRQSKSPTRARSPSKETTKSPSKKKPETLEESTDEDEMANKSASARKRRLIQKKYGIQLKDDEFVQRECKEEMEEFENVAVALRPAATKMRKAKLRWKAASPAKKDIEEEETLESPPDVTGSGWEESMSFVSESDFTDTHDEDKDLNEKYAKRYAALKANPKENVERLLKELHALFLRVDELEQLEKTYLEQIQELKKQLAAKDEKISELSRKTKEVAAAASVPAIPEATEKEILVQATAEKEIAAPAKIEKEAVSTKTVESEKEVDVAKKEKSMKTLAEGEKMTAKLEAVAKRGLDILHRNQLLEQTLNDNETRILATFFESDEPKPDKKVVDLIDKALSYGVEILLTRPDLFEDFVDNELRLFLIDANKAKRILLDCMLLHPQYVPTKWGGNIMRKRQREGLGEITEKMEEQSNQHKITEKEEEKSNQNKISGKEEEKDNQNKITGKEEEKDNQNKITGKEEEKSKVTEEAVKKEVEQSKPTEASTVQAAIQTTRSIFDYLVEASKWAASTSTITAPSASFSKEKPTAKEKTIEMKTLPKSDGSKSKTESENKTEREIKAQPKPSESKSEEEARIKRQASTETVISRGKERKEQGTRGHGKSWKYQKSGSKSPANASWVKDEKRHLRNQAKAKQWAKKKN